MLRILLRDTLDIEHSYEEAEEELVHTARTRYSLHTSHGNFTHGLANEIDTLNKALQTAQKRIQPKGE